MKRYRGQEIERGFILTCYLMYCRYTPEALRVYTLIKQLEPLSYACFQPYA